MSSLSAPAPQSVPTPRYSGVQQHKADGAVYTPRRFAEFVAEQMLAVAKLPDKGRVRVLDPACGDGSLLHALLDALPETVRERLDIVGFDTNAGAVHCSLSRLKMAYPGLSLRIEKRDFLECVFRTDGAGELFSNHAPLESFDLVIANPPYVRTQILGAKQAQLLSERFGLSGRVDLYFPFLLGISQILAPDGVMGVIVSNRFLTTKSGQTVRRELLKCFRIHHVWDLGDTKLFDAAVLPAVLISTGRGFSSAEPIAFSSIYECEEKPREHAADPLAALSYSNGAIVAIPDGRRFHVLHGTLDNGGDPEGVWRVATDTSDTWLETVKAHTWATFSRIGKVRVGVKTTCDKVFVRSDWDKMPENERPELLRPLTTRHCAQRYKPAPAKKPKQILYTHETTPAGRAPVNLARYPRSAKYLEIHRTTLEARAYVIKAGRKWYEIWVPQAPEAWIALKLVFPDISEKPVFWIDKEGTIVNGECYWLRCEGDADPDWLWLALAVANSTFIELFYDRRFHNKLYAGRRRFITQYVEQFPLPDPSSALARSIVEAAKMIYEAAPTEAAKAIARDLDGMIWNAFGLPIEEIPR